MIGDALPLRAVVSMDRSWRSITRDRDVQWFVPHFRFALDILVRLAFCHRALWRILCSKHRISFDTRLSECHAKIADPDDIIL
jgi:hypothetical protein